MLKIGITGSVGSDGNHNLRKEYIDSVINIGHMPYIIPCTGDDKVTESLVLETDCVILSGGYDIAPGKYGESALYKLGTVIDMRDTFDFKVIEAAVKYGKPLFGICRGLQCINVFFGGSLFQDIHSQLGIPACKHDQTEPTEYPSHGVSVLKGSRLYSLSGAGYIKVNSHHHQAVKKLGKGLIISAEADDGVVEAIESVESDIIAVQFHPERMVECGAPGLKLLESWTRYVESR
jgi:peptidase C26